MNDVVVVRTSNANLASVIAALERLDCRVRTTADPDLVASADRLVLPGVGAFSATQSTLANHNLEAPLQERIARARPTLGICLGMQLMAEGSEEAPGIAGLGVMNGFATRFPNHNGLRVPQMGWNRIQPADDCRIIPPGYAYFANSYRIETAPEGWLPVWCDYGGPFLAAAERGPVVACQFHPELSGAYGKVLLTRWLAAR